MTEFMLASLANNKIDHGPTTIREGLAPPTELKFELDGVTQQNIATAEKHFTELVSAHDLHVCTALSLTSVRLT